MKTTFIRFLFVTLLSFFLSQNTSFAIVTTDTEDTNINESSCLDITYYMSTSLTRSSSVTQYTRAQSTDANTEGQVSLLQAFLKDKGYMNASVLTTGRYGSLTRSAVKSLQLASGFSQTGATGPLTRAKIKELSCDESASDGDTSTGSNPSQSSSSNGTLPSGSFSFIGNTSCVAGAAGTCTITLSWPNVTAPLTTKKLKYTIAGSVTEIPLSDYSLSSKSRQFTAYADPITVVIASGTEILASATITSTCPTNLPTRSSSGGCIASSSSSASNFLLTVEKTGTGSGTITSSPSGISCGTVCTKNLSSGIGVTLTATPISPSTFTGWSGACTGTGLCNVSMVAARQVRAVFELNVSRSASDQPSSQSSAPNQTTAQSANLCPDGTIRASAMVGSTGCEGHGEGPAISPQPVCPHLTNGTLWYPPETASNPKPCGLTVITSETGGRQLLPGQIFVAPNWYYYAKNSMFSQGWTSAYSASSLNLVEVSEQKARQDNLDMTREFGNHYNFQVMITPIADPYWNQKFEEWKAKWKVDHPGYREYPEYVK